jgi:hypothetical protein
MDMVIYVLLATNIALWACYLFFLHDIRKHLKKLEEMEADQVFQKLKRAARG